MKQLVLCTFLLLHISSYAQYFEINPYGGLTFGGTVLAENGKLAFHSSGHAGLNLNYFFNEKHGMYADFMAQPTKVDVWQTDLSNDKDVIDINLNWFQLGYIYNTDYKKFKPFIGFSLGATYIKPKNTRMYPSTVFSITGFGGVNFKLTDNFGLQLKGKFLYPAGFGKELEYQSIIIGDPIKFKSNFVQGSLSLGIFFKI